MHRTPEEPETFSAADRVASEVVLSFEIVLSGRDGLAPASGGVVAVQSFALPAGRERADAQSDRVRPRAVVQTTAGMDGHASVAIPASTTHVAYSVTHDGRYWARGHWAAGEPTAIRVVLQPCAALRALIRGPVPPGATLLIQGQEIGQGLRVPVEGARTDVPYVPVAWSPARVVLRQTDGAEYLAEAVDLDHGAVAEVVFDTTENVASLRGLLVDERGDPVPHASVFVSPMRAVKGFSYAEMSTGSDGLFAFSGLPATLHRIAISPLEHARCHRDIDLRTQPNADLGQIVLRRGVTVTGSVAAVARGRVRFAGVQEVGMQGWGPEAKILSGRRVAIDQGGRFVIDRLSSGRFLVWVSTDLLARDAVWAGRIVELGEGATEGQTVDVGELALPGELRWSGVVHSADGSPWPEGARCVAMGLEEPWWSTSALAADGSATMAVGRGASWVGFIAGGRWRWVQRMPASGAATEVWEPSGSVTLVSETELPEGLYCDLEFVPASPAAGSVARAWHTGACRLRVEGRTCTLRGLAAGAYRMYVSRGRIELSPLGFTLREGESLLLLWPIDWR